MNHWHSFISFNHWSIRNWHLFKFSYLGGFLDTHRPINSLSRVINKKKSNSTVYSTASATPPICLAGKICVTFHCHKCIFHLFFISIWCIKLHMTSKKMQANYVLLLFLWRWLLNSFTLLYLSSQILKYILTCLEVMNYIVHIKVLYLTNTLNSYTYAMTFGD